METRLKDLLLKLSGDPVIRAHSEPVPPSISRRVKRVVYGQWTSTSAPTQTQRDAYQIASEEFTVVLEDLRVLIEEDLASLEEKMESAGAPWTPGRVLRWKAE